MRELDGTKDKGKLGANAMVAVSMAVLRAAAASEGKLFHDYLGGDKMPVAMFNVINGGKHAGSGLAIQEFMIIPEASMHSASASGWRAEIYHVLGKQLAAKYGSVSQERGRRRRIRPCP